MDDTDSNIHKFNLIPTPNVNEKTTIPITMFNYHPTELKMMLVYGTDLDPPRKNPLAKYFALKSSRAAYASVIVFAALLFFIRRKFRLRHDGFISAYIDVFICHFGGENLRMTHRIEKWFFAFWWIASFFMHAIIGALVFDTIWLSFNNKIVSIEQITTINPPILLNPSMAENEQSIKTILRCDHYDYFISFRTCFTRSFFTILSPSAFSK